MAIVKATYTRRRSTGKASVRYIQHRPGQDGERLTRQLFGSDGALTRDEAYQLIDQAPRGTTFYRLIISPDPRKEDTDRDLSMRQLTEQTLSILANRQGAPIPYVGAIHADHAAHRHVHVIALLKGRLTRKDFQFLREQATEASRMQRLELDTGRGISQDRSSQPSSSGGSLSSDSINKCPVCGQINCLIHDSGHGLG